MERKETNMNILVKFAKSESNGTSIQIRVSLIIMSIFICLFKEIMGLCFVKWKYSTLTFNHETLAMPI